MQDVSTAISISVEEYKQLLLESHDAGRYLGEMYKLRKEIEELRKENEELRISVAYYEKELAGDTNT